MSLIRLSSELTPLEKLSVMPMSYSRLETFSKCPVKYFYQYIEKVPDTGSPAAYAGTAVHEVLEETDLNDMVIGDLLERLDGSWEKHDPNREISPELKGEMVRCVEQFVYDNEDTTFDVVGKELEFEVALGGFLFRGFIDLVERHKFPDYEDEGLIITDYKTGKWTVPKKDVPTNIQSGLYGAVARYLFPDMWPIRVQFYYLRTGKKVGHTFTHSQLDRVEESIVELSSKVKNAVNFLPTKDHWICKSLCSYGKVGHCKTGERAVNFR